MVLVDPLLNPLLSLEPIYAILIIAITLSFLSMLATKYMTDQKKMKAHREQLKSMQKKFRDVRDNPKKAMQVQQEMMELNMVVMKESFKPMLLTIIPFLLVFGWLNASFSFIPIAEGNTFTVTASGAEGSVLELVILPDSVTIANSTATIMDGAASWELSGPNGEYTLQFLSEDTLLGEQDLIIGNTYATPEKKHNDAILQKTIIGNEQLKIKLLFWDAGWIWSYIVYSIVSSLILRKLLRIY